MRIREKTHYLKIACYFHWWDKIEAVVSLQRFLPFRKFAGCAGCYHLQKAVQQAVLAGTA